MTDRRVNLPAILSDIAKGRVRLEYRQELAEIVYDWSRDYGARFDSIASGRQNRSDRIRQAVRTAAGQVMSERPGLTIGEATRLTRKRAWSLLKGAATDKKPACPCIRTVKSELLPYFKKDGTCGATYSNHAVYSSSTLATT